MCEKYTQTTKSCIPLRPSFKNKQKQQQKGQRHPSRVYTGSVRGIPYRVGTRVPVSVVYGQRPYAALTFPYDPLLCPYRPGTGMFIGLVFYSLLTFISSVDSQLCKCYIVSHVDFFLSFFLFSCNCNVSGSCFTSVGWDWLSVTCGWVSQGQSVCGEAESECISVRETGRNGWIFMKFS